MRDHDEELGRELRRAFAKAADTVEMTGDPMRVIDHAVWAVEKELDVEIRQRDLESCTQFGEDLEKMSQGDMQ